MYKKQERIIAEKERAIGDVEVGTKAQELKNGRIIIVPRETEDFSRDGASRDGSQIELTDQTRRSRTS